MSELKPYRFFISRSGGYVWIRHQRKFGAAGWLSVEASCHLNIVSAIMHVAAKCASLCWHEFLPAVAREMWRKSKPLFRLTS